MNAYLFVDYKFFGMIESESLIQAICSHQFRNADTTERIYTALDKAQNFAFSQMYQKLGDGKARHGTMFKHELGQLNPPPIPSYDELIKRIPKYPRAKQFAEKDVNDNRIFLGDMHKELALVELPWQKRGLQQTATGYGAKLTSSFKISFEGKLYRLYHTCYGNASSCWFTVKGRKIYVS